MRLIYFLQKTLPIVFWVLLIFGFDSTHTAILTIIAAFIHEIGHLLAILLFCKRSAELPIGDISGFRIKTAVLSYREEIIVALGGPMINLAVGLLCMFLPFTDNFAEYIGTFGLLNIMTMISNLLPIEDYDGYKAAVAAIALISKDSSRGERILYRISFMFSSVMCFLALYLMLKLGEGYWIFAVFFSVTLPTIIKRQKHTICENN